MLAAQRDTCYNKSFRGPEPFLLRITFAKNQPFKPPSRTLSQWNFFFFPTLQNFRNERRDERMRPRTDVMGCPDPVHEGRDPDGFSVLPSRRRLHLLLRFQETGS